MNLQNTRTRSKARRSSCARNREVTCVLITTLLLSSAFFLSACQAEKPEEKVEPKKAPPASSASPTNTAGSADFMGLNYGGPTTEFYVDWVNGDQYMLGSVVPIKADIAQITVSGWGADYKNKKPGAGLFMKVDDQADIPASYGEERKDVAAFFKNDNYTKTGFTAKVPTAGLAKGKHILTFKIVSADNKEYFVPPRRLEIDLK
jgi:hypothetical protein